MLLEGKVDGDPDKVYSLGETVSYSHNGLKLFEIKVTGIRVSSNNNRTLVDFVFTPYSFIEPSSLADFLSAQLIDDTTQTT